MLENTKSDLTVIKKFMLWCSGVNTDVLIEYGRPSDYQRFQSIGLVSFMSALVPLVGFVYYISYTFSNIVFALVTGLGCGILFLVLNRAIATTSKNGNKILPWFIDLGRLMLSVVMGAAISILAQIVIFQKEIAAYSSPLFHLSNIEALKILSKIKDEHLGVRLDAMVINISFIAIETAPFMLSILLPSGRYEIGLELVELENRKIKLQQNAEIDQIKIEIENDKRRKNLQTEAEESILRQELKRKISKRQDVDIFPLGGFEFYFDYKTLTIENLNLVFSSIQKIYNSVYAIENIQMPQGDYSFIEFNEDTYKTHPEDILQIHSIETGNSVTFKISTGWKPKIELIEGDFIVSMPKGSLALLIAGYVMMKIFDYGISNYKEVLEIEKLQKEIKADDNNKEILDQLKIFNQTLSSSPKAVQENFQNNLNNFYDVTVGNSNFIKTKMIPDDKLLNKLGNGTIVIPR